MNQNTIVTESVAETPWPWKGYGNHRAVLRVDRSAQAARATIPWRRRDAHPERIGLRVVRMDDGAEVENVVPLSVTRERGEIVFEAARAGRYAVYFMPFEIEAKEPWNPAVYYRPADYSRVDSVWRGRADAEPLPLATVEAIEARTENDRFDPMEMIAGAGETAGMVARCGDRPFFLFPEDRLRPIRMRDDLPVHWVRQGPSGLFEGEAAPNEYYVFQVGVWARLPLRGVRVSWSALEGEDGAVLPETAVTCFNLGGVDWLGRPFRKRVDVSEGQVQALWFGVDLPPLAAGRYRATLVISAEGLSAQEIEVDLRVGGAPLADRGDAELWRHSRLRWLNSTIGLDDELPAGYPALLVDGTDVTCLGRTVRFGGLGLPERIASFFAPSVDCLQDTPMEILAGPLDLVVQTPGGRQALRADTEPSLRRVSPAACEVEGAASGAELRLRTQVRMEYDGHLDCRLTLTADRSVELTDLALEIPIRRDAATFMMGMGRQGGYRPESWEYRWDLDRANHCVWLGTVNAGLHLKLKHNEDVWALSNLHACGFPGDWHNQGRGGAALREQDNGDVLLRAFCGPRTLAAGESVTLRFSLMVTPLKLLDLKAHWTQRYHHLFVPWGDHPDADEVKRIGATVINLHSGGMQNPYINYPFLTADAIRALSGAAHARGLKTKIYYTVREMTSRAVELWAFRSLNGEIYPEGGKAEIADFFAEKPATPAAEEHAPSAGAWLREHLVDRYVGAWHEWLPNGEIDEAISTTGLSRLHNYYLEGLRWLIREAGIDGLYLDGIGYDRQVMKRVRKVLDRTRPGCLLDFHSGNNFHPAYGMGSALALHAELLPSIDSLWMGEGFDYESATPEYFLTEISGIPFGLTNDMLQMGGNPWRGMLYGMTCRFGWCQGGDPRHLWALWDSFGIREARMYGYWHPECPVRTDHPQVLATAYVKPDGATLIALASWAPEPVTCRLSIDGSRLALSAGQASTLDAPAIINFQDTARYTPDQAIPVDPGRGRILLLGASAAMTTAAADDVPADAPVQREAPLTVPRRKAPVNLDEISDWLEAHAVSLPLIRDGMTCGAVRLGVAGDDLVVEIVSHDAELSRHPRRVDKSSGCELFVAADAAAPPVHWIFLPAAGEAPAEAQAYSGPEIQPVPSSVFWRLCPRQDGYRLLVRAPLSAFEIDPAASEFRFDCAVNATEPLPYWIRTRAQLAGARYPFADAQGLARVVVTDAGAKQD